MTIALRAVLSEQAASTEPPAPSRQSLRGLDWFIFFLADVQTGFGPFVAVYLTTQKWTQVEIGFVLSIGGIDRPDRADARRRHRRCRALRTAGGEPCGRDHRRAARSRMPHGRSFRWSRPLRPCMPPRAACSVRRLPRSASAWSARSRSASGSGAMPALPRSATASAAAVMGTCGYLLSSRSVFLVTFVLAIPTLLALARIREREIDVGAGPRRGAARGARRQRHQRAAVCCASVRC